MARNIEYVSIDRVVAKLYRDIGLEDIPESTIIEQAGEALEAIGVTRILEQSVAFVEVRGHVAQLPRGLTTIIQVARDNHWEEDKLSPLNLVADLTNKQIEEATKKLDNGEHCEECEKFVDNNYVVLDCDGRFVDGDFNIAYYRPFADLQYWYNDWKSSNIYRSRYSPMRLATHSFFNTLVCEEDPEIYKSCKDEYTVQDGIIKTSFKEGYIAVAYYRHKIDPETGYPMIPDDYSVLTAITNYVTMKYMARMYYNGKEGYGDKFMKAEQDWQWYCKQSSNKLFMSHGADEFQNFGGTRNHLMPNNNSFYGFFGNMSDRENRSYLRTRRNRRVGY